MTNEGTGTPVETTFRESAAIQKPINQLDDEIEVKEKERA
jgi:hypothetical protein